ncbi:MAG: molybdopterin dinucleotide binding domain-containing protein, partial [Planctomycetota bacterium]
GFSSAEEFVRNGCENTPGVKEAGGFEYMKKHGAWYDKNAKPAYFSHTKKVDVTGATLDEATGVYYKKGPNDKDYSSLDSKHANAQYVAQQCGDGVARKGFPPDKYRWKTGFLELRSKALAETGFLELRSKALADKGFDALPSWMPIPEHEKMGPDDLVLTTFKVATQTHSRTQSCKWLTEIYHENPMWIHPDTAAERGIKNGALVKVRSSIGEITTKARVTDCIVPGVVAISNHMGHWAYGGYASGKSCKTLFGHVCEIDCHHKWWGKNSKDRGPKVWRAGRGVHANWIIPNVGDPIGGGLRWMDTVVKVTKA